MRCPNAYAPMPNSPAQTIPPATLNRKKRDQGIRFTPARPQHGHEPAKEHHLAAVSSKKILAELDPPRREPQVVTIADQHATADLVPQPEAEIVPDHGPSNRSEDDQSK